MENNLEQLWGFISLCAYMLAIFAAITLPIWGYNLLEKHFHGKHEALRVTNQSGKISKTAIVASVGTTTAGVFTIQILPLLFSMVNDLGGSFAVNTVYGDYMSGSGMGEYVDNFYALTAQLGEMLQTAAPMAAVGLGGFNLLNNLSRGLPAIRRSNRNSFILETVQVRTH